MHSALTAVLVDRWPIVRLGLKGVLRTVGVEVVGEASRIGEGLLVGRARQAQLLLVGAPSDGVTASSVRSAKQQANGPKVVLLISGAAASEVGPLFAAGADGLLAASAEPTELVDALERVLAGERVVGSTLSPALRGSAVAGASPAAHAGTTLTGKELEVLFLLAQGHSTKQIARALFVSEATIKTHLQHIYAKLAVQNRHGALSRAAELGLLTG